MKPFDFLEKYLQELADLCKEATEISEERLNPPKIEKEKIVSELKEEYESFEFLGKLSEDGRRVYILKNFYQEELERIVGNPIEKLSELLKPFAFFRGAEFGATEKEKKKVAIKLAYLKEFLKEVIKREFGEIDGDALITNDFRVISAKKEKDNNKTSSKKSSIMVPGRDFPSDSRIGRIIQI